MRSFRGTIDTVDMQACCLGLAGENVERVEEWVIVDADLHCGLGQDHIFLR